MKSTSGKISFGTLLILFVIFYGIFAGIKLGSAKMTESEISEEVENRVGTFRGSDFNADFTKNEILKILEAHQQKGEITFNPDIHKLTVEASNNKTIIHYIFEYDWEAKLLFFTKKKTVLVDEEMNMFM